MFSLLCWVFLHNGRKSTDRFKLFAAFLFIFIACSRSKAAVFISPLLDFLRPSGHNSPYYENLYENTGKKSLFHIE